MEAFLAVLPVALQILNALPTLIQTAEAVFSGRDKSGPAKKRLVMTAVNAGLDAAAGLGVKELTPQAIDGIRAVTDKATDAIVAGFNAADAFKRPAVTAIAAIAATTPAPPAGLFDSPDRYAD